MSQSSSNAAESSHSSKPACKYGYECYRTGNPKHMVEYSHSQSQNSTEPGKTASSGASAAKKPRTSAPGRSVLAPEIQVNLAEKCQKYSFYMTRVRGIDESFNQGSALTLRNVLTGTKAKLVKLCCFSYVYEVDWLVRNLAEENQDKPMLLVFAKKGEDKKEFLETVKQFPNINTCEASLDSPYGTHHTKMIILQYETGIRIIITTANLAGIDWDNKSQALWSSPLLPRGVGESPTGFKSDMIMYLRSYRRNQLASWIQLIQEHDFTNVKVFLIGSTPGRHTGEMKAEFGHTKLRKVLSEHIPPSCDNKWSLFAQFSSIGSLGATPDKWLKGEFCKSLAATKTPSPSRSTPSLYLMYPTVEDVRSSLLGYDSGQSLPYARVTHEKQAYLRKFMNRWSSDCRGRSRASPHIKTYYRASANLKEMPWFLMTSANLSKAAWGCLEKDNTQLHIFAYELGVLFIPQMYGLEKFSIDPSFTTSDAFPLTADIPDKPYTSTDEPWVYNMSYNIPDHTGSVWSHQGYSIMRRVKS